MGITNVVPRTSPRSWWLGLLATVLLAPGPGRAVDTLVVGQGVRLAGWRNIADWGGVSQVTVRYDSVFRWDVSAGANLATGLLARQGSLTGRFALDDTTWITGPLAGLERLVDGDPNTVFNPDDYPEIPRGLQVIVDLGAAFSVNHVRLFPRLDQNHRLLFPQLFGTATSDGSSVDLESMSGFVPISSLSFQNTNPNQEPVVDRYFASRAIRYLRLSLDPVRPWEIAELEIYGDGTAPMGTFQSVPLLARHTYPVWGRARYEGGDLAGLPIVLQTRTGPDASPIQYFRRTGVGDDLAVVAAGTYNAIPEEERGPVRPNPEWSDWETVTDGVVRSPGMRRYLQFRVYLPQAGTVLRRLVFEYAQPAVVHHLRGEVDPRLVEPGRDTTFTLSLVVHMLTSRASANTTGFRQLQILTAAAIDGVDKVLVDDQEVSFTPQVLPGQGLALHLGQRVVQDGTFLQVVLRAAVFRDGTRFEVRAVDRRVVDRRVEEVYQVARSGDVDPASAGGDLVVRLAGDQGQRSLLANLSCAAAFTPNGDGVNDTWRLAYDLLALTRPARVRVELFDLAGRLVRQIYEGDEGNGHHLSAWDGRDHAGHVVPPGVYLYRVRVDADDRSAAREGTVGVAL